MIDPVDFRSVSGAQQLLASWAGGEPDGVPDPGTARGAARRRRGLPGWAEASCVARSAAPPPQRGGVIGPVDRRVLGRGLARTRRRRAARQRLAAAQGASGERSGDQVAGLRRPDRAGRARPAPLRAACGRGAEAARPRARGGRVGAATRRALAVARPSARRLRLRELCPVSHRPARRDQAGGGRAPDRRRPRARAP